MTSRISFSKMAYDEVKKLTWLTAVQGLCFFLLIPFRVLLTLAPAPSTGYIMDKQDLTDVFCSQVGLGRYENLIFILVMGILCAYVAFHYLQSPVKLDFYHSLPVTRERLFAVKLFGSSVTFVIAYVCSQVLAVLVGLIYGAVPAGAVLEIAAATVHGILCFFCSYSGALLAMMLTGKMLTAVLATGILGLYLPMIFLLEMMFKEVFFTTSLLAYDWGGRIEVLQYTSPWALCVLRTGNYDGERVLGLTGYWPDMALLCQLLTVAVLLLLISAALYRIRKTEAAGDALAFRRMEAIVKIMLSIPSALIAAAVAYEIYDSVIWELVFLILFGTLGCIIMELIYRFDIRQALRHKMHIVLTVAAAAAIFIVFRFDIIGYNTYLPDKEELQAMAVKENWYDFNYVIGGEVYSSNGSMDEKTILSYLETEDFDALYRIAENGVENSSVNEYLENLCCVNVKYLTKDGKEAYRSYWVDTDLYLGFMGEKMEDEEFRKAYYPILTWDEAYIKGLDQVVGYISPEAWNEASDTAEEAVEEEVDPEYGEYVGEYEEYADGQSEDTYVTVPVSRIPDVIEAYRKDLAQLSYSDIWYSRGSLEFDHYVTQKFSGARSYEVYPISEAFTNTVKLLKEFAEEEEQ